MSKQIDNVCIIGAGFMGAEIASRSAVFGCNVSVFDINPDALVMCRETVEKSIQAKVDLKVVEGDPAQAAARVSYYEDMSAAVQDADLIIEAVLEEVDIKKEVFARLDQMTPSHVLIGTNSSSIPVSQIEEGVEHKERVLNIHFSPPIDRLYYVELMRGSKTSEKTIARVSAWVKRLECLPLVCKKESIGFVFNRVWHAARREALKVWAEGVAEYKDVDRAWMLFSGMPLGPFGIMDFIGLDIVYKVQNLYYEETGDDYFTPPKELKDMVDQGNLGMKTGKGFYDWSDPDFGRSDFLKPKRTKD